MPEPIHPIASPPPFRGRPGRPGFFGSFVHAWNGLIHTLVHQRNMKVHHTAAVLVSLVGSGIPLGLAEKVTLIFCVLLVFFAEILNSALEQLVDLATEELNPKARVAKDAAAAGVLVLAVGTVVIFVAILLHNTDTLVAFEHAITRQVAVGLPLTLATIVLVTSNGRRPAAIDLAAAALALVFWGLQARASYSGAFSGMGFGLVVIAAAAARQARHEAQASAPG